MCRHLSKVVQVDHTTLYFCPCSYDSKSTLATVSISRNLQHFEKINVLCRHFEKSERRKDEANFLLVENSNSLTPSGDNQKKMPVKLEI